MSVTISYPSTQFKELYGPFVNLGVYLPPKDNSPFCFLIAQFILIFKYYYVFKVSLKEFYISYRSYYYILFVKIENKKCNQTTSCQRIIRLNSLFLLTLLWKTFFFLLFERLLFSKRIFFSHFEICIWTRFVWDIIIFLY